MERRIKISWNKPGGNASPGSKPTAKISIPTAMIKALEIGQDDDLIISLEDGYLKITKVAKEEDNA